MELSTPCQLWKGSLNGVGYGKFGRNYKTILAHRDAWEQVNGPIPEGLQLDHLCRVRNCINPDHLELVTCRENLMRGATLAAANAKKTHCAHGHLYDERNTKLAKGERICRACSRDKTERYRLKKNPHPRRKLLPGQVVEIRSALGIGESRRGIAARYGVCPETVGHIARGTTWKTI